VKAFNPCILLACLCSWPVAAQFVCNDVVSCSSSSSPALTVSYSNGTSTAYAMRVQSTYAYGISVSSAGGHAVVGATTGGGVPAILGETNACGAFGIAGRTTTSTGGCGGYGVYGDSTNGQYAGHFTGTVDVWDTIVVGGSKNFVIDHPLDAKLSLVHAGMEAPEYLTIYDGVAILDRTGKAVVELPIWFSALNTDLEYQLSTIDGYAAVFVSKTVDGNRFEIAGGIDGMQVAWQITGRRQDVYAITHPFVVEVEKAPSEREAYLASQRGEDWVKHSPHVLRDGARKAARQSIDRSRSDWFDRKGSLKSEPNRR